MTMNDCQKFLAAFAAACFIGFGTGFVTLAPFIMEYGAETGRAWYDLRKELGADLWPTIDAVEFDCSELEAGKTGCDFDCSELASGQTDCEYVMFRIGESQFLSKVAGMLGTGLIVGGLLASVFFLGITICQLIKNVAADKAAGKKLEACEKGNGPDVIKENANQQKAIGRATDGQNHDETKEHDDGMKD